MLDSNAITFLISQKRIISNEFCQKKLSTLRFWGILEYIAPKLENVGKFVQVSINAFPTALLELQMTKIINCSDKVLAKETFCMASVT